MNISLTQALQSFLLSKDFSLIKEFCLSAHPAIVADFLSSLEPQEIWSVLSALDPHKRAEVFCQIDEDSQVALANRLSRLDLAALVTDMSPELIYLDCCPMPPRKCCFQPLPRQKGMISGDLFHTKRERADLL